MPVRRRVARTDCSDSRGQARISRRSKADPNGRTSSNSQTGPNGVTAVIEPGKTTIKAIPASSQMQYGQVIRVPDDSCDRRGKNVRFMVVSLMN